MNSFVLGDSQRCIGCQACMIACAMAHESVSATELVTRKVPFVPRVTLVNVPEVTVPVQCRQCEDSPCANACPVGALVERGGHIEVIADRCIGCKGCVLACPFGAIQVVEAPSEQAGLMIIEGGWDGASSPGPMHPKSLFVVSKCDLCGDLGAPACVGICPAGALRLIEPTQIHDAVLAKRRRAAAGMGHCPGH